MDANTRARLRQGVESLVRAAIAQSAKPGGCPVGVSRKAADGSGAQSLSVYVVLNDEAEHPPLSPAQQLGLSVLLNDEAVVPQVLADYLLDYGHEYATAVAHQAAAEERKRCVEAVRFATQLVREFIENAPGEQLTWSSQGVIDLFEWAHGEIEEPQRPGG